MHNYDPICLLINEDCDKLMAQSVINVGDDFSIDREVFRYAFCPLLNVLDNNFVELMKVLSLENKEQKSGDEISNGRKATADTLRECVEDLSQRMNKASDAQDYEKAAYFQSLIGKCDDILKVL